MAYFLLFLAASLAIGSESSELQVPEGAIAEPQDDLQTEDEIIVEAPPKPLDRRRELRNMASEVIRKPRRQQPIGSFFHPVCPRVFGVPDTFARAIEKRMRRNAVDLGVTARSRSDCNHNISVVFMAPGAGPPETWLEDDARVLRHLLSYERKWVLDEEGPVRAWNRTVLRDYDGTPQKNRNGVSIDQVESHNQVRLASRLNNSVTSEIVSSVVLIELASAEGKSVAQLADYASMRSFANIAGLPPEEPVAAPTILTLFQDEQPVGEMTEFDRALISKLYSSPRNSWAYRVHSNIAASALRMEQESGVSE